jgi:hypothetical protein
MASGTNTSTSKIATIIVLIPILAALWYAAPWFLPMWRWQNVDFEEIARKNAEAGYTQKKLEQEFDFLVYYNPRGGRGSKDPCPFQIITMTPTWKSVYPNGIDEFELLVRISLVDDRDGNPIDKIWVGSIAEEGFFKIQGWRLPPGSCGKPKGRPVVVYKGLSMEKLDLSKAISLMGEVKSRENDDLWEERDDGWYP